MASRSNLIRLVTIATHDDLQLPSCSFLQVPAITSQQLGSDLKQAAPDSDGNGVRPIVGPQFVHQVFDVEVDGRLCDCEVIGDLFVAIAVANQAQDFQFSRGEVVVAHVFGEAGRDFGRNVAPASVH